MFPLHHRPSATRGERSGSNRHLLGPHPSALPIQLRSPRSRRARSRTQIYRLGNCCLSVRPLAYVYFSHSAYIQVFLFDPENHKYSEDAHFCNDQKCIFSFFSHSAFWKLIPNALDSHKPCSRIYGVAPNRDQFFPELLHKQNDELLLASSQQNPNSGHNHHWCCDFPAKSSILNLALPCPRRT